VTTSSALDSLVAGVHADPHAFLGAHPVSDGLVVRTLQPRARTVTVVAGNDRWPLDRTDAGVFEGVVPGASFPFDYRLDVEDHHGRHRVVADPYSFAPTLGPLDLWLLAEGHHHDVGWRLGARGLRVGDVDGVAFAVWAPAARGVRVIGDFDEWSHAHPMRSLGASGVWELFVPDAGPGHRYKYEITTPTGSTQLKADPVAHATEEPPRTASVVARHRHQWDDDEWMARRRASRPWQEPMSIYEVHLGSWRRGLSYRELGEELGDYVAEMGFTHVELMPVMEHPFAGSWGYQVTGFYAPTARFGSPDDLRAMIDALHRRGIGVILDWVPAHFPSDPWALARFDGTALYEHDDPQRARHPEWGTLEFNYGRHEVRNFLIGSALWWVREFHADGLRVDAVASMLYLDYSRDAGAWQPNAFGGREDLDAIAFLRELNEVLHQVEPGVLAIAEESTAWPGVTAPTDAGGLGFGFKWNMGWMHDTLGYFSKDPVHRRHHHHALTFGMTYAHSEHYVLPLSHDEVVHGKGSLLGKMPGDRWQQLANLRALFAHMWAHPGKQLLFMGGELAQWREWNHDTSLDWDLLEHSEHRGVQRLVRDLNTAYRAEPALWEADRDPRGFEWIAADEADLNVYAFARTTPSGRVLVCIENLSPVPRRDWRVGMPRLGAWREVLNTDAARYGGSDVGNGGTVVVEPVPAQGRPWSAVVTLPPLGVIWLVPERDR
jgi:1,4-alpha-glucan branching enzyme